MICILPSSNQSGFVGPSFILEAMGSVYGVLAAAATAVVTLVTGVIGWVWRSRAAAQKTEKKMENFANNPQVQNETRNKPRQVQELVTKKKLVDTMNEDMAEYSQEDIDEADKVERELKKNGAW